MAPLSEQAMARLARGSTPEPPMPAIDDLVAIAEWRREQHLAWGEVHDAHAAHEVHREVHVEGIRCLEAGSDAEPTLVYVHGGGHVLGSPEVAVPITARLAVDVHVISVDYRLAPEHPFPAAVDDVVAVCAAIGASRTFSLGGDSAGAGIALAAALRLRARGGPRPSSLVLLCPFVRQIDSSPLSRAYVQGSSFDDPGASPLLAELGGLPPVLLQTGDADHLHGQALELADRARSEGVSLQLDVWEGLWHAWQYHRDIPEADDALALVRSFLHRLPPPAS